MCQNALRPHGKHYLTHFKCSRAKHNVKIKNKIKIKINDEEKLVLQCYFVQREKYLFWLLSLIHVKKVHIQRSQ